MRYGWDHPDTARYYEAFNESHPRYRTANEALIAAAHLAAGQSILDLGAGTGRTAELAHEALGGQCDIVCLEPAGAMREIGLRRLPHVRWISSWPTEERFDRILCGAAVWQFYPLAETFLRIAALLQDGGAFVLNCPSLYLGEADAPGGGGDPMLLKLSALVADGRNVRAEEFPKLPDTIGMEDLLLSAGLRPIRWGMRTRLTQAELRDWLKIPVLTDALLEDLDADSRAALLNAAFLRSDSQSWRWEAWTGWTAWKESKSP